METAIIQKTRINEQVYEYLKDLIINNKLKPNEKIGISEYAKALDVSRMPVNTALMRLQSEGYVEIRPQAGSFVREFSTEELKVIFRCRAAMEREILAMNGHLLSKAPLLDFRNKFTALFEIGSCTYDILMKNFDLDVSFHLFIVHSCSGIILEEMINIMELTKRSRILQIQKIVHESKANIREIEIKTHIDIINAILEDRYVDASELVYRDILDTWSRIEQ